MKITRALLLSSKKQAESWEYTSTGGIFRWKTYRYLIDDRKCDGDMFRFRVFYVHQEQEPKAVRTCDVVAPSAHVDEVFEDMGKLITFLRRYQIDFEEAWQPVEGDEPC